MLQHIQSALLCGVLLALPASSQETCSNLAIKSELDPVRPLQTVTLDVTGVQPNALVYVVASRQEGATTVNLRALGSFELGLARPFTATLIGTADPKGELSRTQTIPSDIGLTLFVQSVGVKMTPAKGTPKADFCTSNVVQVDL